MNRQRKWMTILAAVLALGMAGSTLAAEELVWWKFDQNSGTTASDASGNDNAGTLRNMAGTEWTAGRLGKCLQFGGANDSVVRNALSSNITGDCTISVWMNRAGLPATNARLMDLATADGSGMQLLLYAATGCAGMDNNGGLTDEIAGTRNLCDGTWHHVAAVRTGTAFRLYVDGALVSSNSNPANTAPTYTRLAVAGTINGRNYFQGRIDDVRVYSRSLSKQKIQMLYNSGSTAPIDIGGRLELFIDRYLIRKLDNAMLELHRPVPREVVFHMDAPWEGNYSGYDSVVKDGGTFRYYYRGMHRSKGHVQARTAKFPAPAVTCCMISSDGVTWKRPSFGMYEFAGSRDNNIIWMNESADAESGYSSQFTVSLNTNPHASAQEKFIALGHNPRAYQVSGKWYGRQAIFTSPDGVRFTMKPDPVMELKQGDGGTNEVIWDSNLGQYAAYMRVYYHPKTGELTGWGHPKSSFRWAARSLSADLAKWSTPVALRFKDALGGDAPPEHLYTFSGDQYFRAPHLYIAMPSRFMAERKAVKDWYRNGVNDGVLLTSRDGLSWDRTFMEAFIRPGTDMKNWTSRSLYPTRGIVQTAPDELSVYWSERCDHGRKEMRIRRGTLRLDGFASVSARYAGGEMTTKPIVFSGKRLVLNYSTSAAGSVRVEIQDADGVPIKGYALADSPERYGDEIEGVMRWKNGPDVGALAGKPVQLRFVLKDADIYSMRFTK